MLTLIQVPKKASANSLNIINGRKDVPTNSDGQFEPFYFIQAADSQFGLIDRYLKKLEKPGWAEEVKLAERFVVACNKLDPKPKFIVVCGDLVDAYPGARTRRQQVGEFKRIFSKIDKQIPLVCLCGNHDVGDEPTMNSLIEYKKDFGEDYYHFIVNDVLFIVINSQFYKHRANVEDYAKKHDEWLEEILKKCKLFKYSIVFEHIPWFLERFDEEDQYFNINREVRFKWLAKFYQAGVDKIMCGHYHQNAGGWYNDMELVVTSAIGAQLGDDISGARIVKVLEDNIEHRYHTLEEFPSKVIMRPK